MQTTMDSSVLQFRARNVCTTILFTLGRELYTFLNVYLQWPQTEIICFTLFVVIAVLQFSHICRDSTRVTWPLQWPQTEIIFFTAELYTIKINNICWKINIRRITTVFTGFKTKPQIYTLAITINDQNTTVGITFYNKNLSHNVQNLPWTTFQAYKTRIKKNSTWKSKMLSSQTPSRLEYNIWKQTSKPVMKCCLEMT